nr:hypothetical protein HmN_000142700 [Hymenolepis microstoma]
MHSAFCDIIFVFIIFNLPLITTTIRWVMTGMILIIPVMRCLLPLLLHHGRSPGRAEGFLAEAMTEERKNTSPEIRVPVKCSLPHEMDNIAKNEKYGKYHPLCIDELKQRLATVQKINSRPKINKTVDNRIATTDGSNVMAVGKSAEKHTPLHMEIRCHPAISGPSGSIHTSNKTGDRTADAKVNCQNMSTQVRLTEGGTDTATWHLENVKRNSRDMSTQVELHEVGKGTPLSSKTTDHQVEELNFESANKRTSSQMCLILFDDLWQKSKKGTLINQGLYEQEDVNYSLFKETHL